MKRLIVIAGPTAVGKTATAIEVAQRLHTDIVSCDSRQFYTEMNIGVARPSEAELGAVRHHFIACRSAADPYNAYSYEQEALQRINELFLQHDDVVAVGGSGLYIDALCKGINLLPDPAPELRASLSARIARGELPALLEELRRLDPDYYAVVARDNPIRIQRALETIITAGRPLSELLRQPLPPRPFAIEIYALCCERDELRDRIFRRVDQMRADGLVDEAASLLPLRHLNTLNTVGYKELFLHFDGKCPLDEALTAIKHNTWLYAKKQMSWLRREEKIASQNTECQERIKFFWVERKNIQKFLQVF